jgi:hypothetical protein
MLVVVVVVTLVTLMLHQAALVAEELAVLTVVLAQLELQILAAAVVEAVV